MRAGPIASDFAASCSIHVTSCVRRRLPHSMVVRDLVFFPRGCECSRKLPIRPVILHRILRGEVNTNLIEQASFLSEPRLAEVLPIGNIWYRSDPPRFSRT